MPCEDRAISRRKPKTLVRRPFDLSSGPLLRLYYLDAPGGDGLLTLVIHDIVFDEWSRGLFWKETAAFYREAGTANRRRSRSLPCNTAISPNGRRSGSRRDASTDSCSTGKAGSPSSPIRYRCRRTGRIPARITDEGRLERWHVGAGRRERAETSRRRSKTPRPSCCCSPAFQILLHRYTGAADIVVGSPVANRRRKETADLDRLLPQHRRAADEARRRSAPRARSLRQVRQTVLEALENQDVSFDRVVEAVKPPRVPGRHPVFQVMFVYQQ